MRNPQLAPKSLINDPTYYPQLTTDQFQYRKEQFRTSSRWYMSNIWAASETILGNA